MATAAKVQANKPITQTGALGYLLWLRRDVPAAYSAVAKQFPEVANFESALQRQSAGLGDDGDTDLSIDTSSFDFSSPSDFSAVSIPVIPDVSIPDITPPAITVTPPDVPTVNMPTDTGGAASNAASLISAGTLANIGQAVVSVTPGLVNVANAVMASNATQKVIATSNAQVAAALAGKSPLQTGIISGPLGTYLAPISSLTGDLSQDFLDLPLWVYLVAAVGLVAVLVAE
jgi:hypothetical protein